MGKWAARLADIAGASVRASTDITAERGDASVLAVPSEGGACEVQAPPIAGGFLAEKFEALELDAVAWTDADIARYLDRRGRLLRWGWSEGEADTLADRLVRRHREADPRVSCVECMHFRLWRCGNHLRAGLQAPDVGRDLAELLQRCSGFLECTRSGEGPQFGY
jgi:hypothetical protein